MTKKNTPLPVYNAKMHCTNDASPLKHFAQCEKFVLKISSARSELVPNGSTIFHLGLLLTERLRLLILCLESYNTNDNNITFLMRPVSGYVFGKCCLICSCFSIPHTSFSNSFLMGSARGKRLVSDVRFVTDDCSPFPALVKMPF